MEHSNFVYYVALLLIVIIGFLVVKKVASCMIKSVVTIALIAAAVTIYWLYLR
jgi:hypothetical protein